MSHDIAEEKRTTSDFLSKVLEQEGSRRAEDARGMLAAARRSARVQTFRNFTTRGGAVNPVIDIASDLLALMMRVAELDHYDGVDALHNQCLRKMEAIELELTQKGYPRTAVVVSRYCLCSMIDEAVMSSSWGQSSDWSERSLLSIFHDETWGGEKYFSILDRLLIEPDKYIENIELLYLGLCLGYEGRYRPLYNGRNQLDSKIGKIAEIIHLQREQEDTNSHTSSPLHPIPPQRVRKYTPLEKPFLYAAIVSVILYCGFFVFNEYRANEVFAQFGIVAATNGNQKP
jgi:type VI secretion system protein ImpK